MNDDNVVTLISGIFVYIAMIMLFVLATLGKVFMSDLMIYIIPGLFIWTGLELQWKYDREKKKMCGKDLPEDNKGWVGKPPVYKKK